MMTIIFLFVSAVSKAIMDCAAIGALTWGAYWNEQIAWCNKWSECVSGTEAFPLSSSVLVFVTSGWHLAQFFMLNTMFGAIVTYKPFFKSKLLDFAALSIGYKIIFEITYRLLRG